MSPLTNASRYRLSDRQTSSVLGDESIILDTKQGIYFGLNETGSAVWSRLQEGPVTILELVAAVCQKFKIDEAACRTDVERLLGELVAEQLVLEDR